MFQLTRTFARAVGRPAAVQRYVSFLLCTILVLSISFSLPPFLYGSSPFLYFSFTILTTVLRTCNDGRVRTTLAAVNCGVFLQANGSPGIQYR